MRRAGRSWRPSFFPHGAWPQVSATAVQAALRTVFERWGCPQQLRVDNGGPWGSTAGLPTVFELWLVGLGVGLIRNHPGKPQENGVIERSQGVGKRWAEPGQCAHWEELQQRLNEEDRIQREEYPYGAQGSRIQAWPWLAHSGRGYTRRWEDYCWDLRLVREHLGRYRVVRKVSSEGKVSIYQRDRHVGKGYAGQQVWVGLVPESCVWRIGDLAERELRCCAASEINERSIRELCWFERVATGPGG